MTTELRCLALVCAFTGVLWIPYVLHRIRTGAFFDRIAYGRAAGADSAWSVRLIKAHANAAENLVVFAPLVLAVNAAGLRSTTTAAACVTYLIARVIHAVAYTFAIPLVRTLAFLIGFSSQAILAWVLLAH